MDGFPIQSERKLVWGDCVPFLPLTYPVLVVWTRREPFSTYSQGYILSVFCVTRLSIKNEKESSSPKSSGREVCVLIREEL